MENQSQDRFLKSGACMATVSQFLGIHDSLNMNGVNKKFYNEVVPTMFSTNHQYPSTDMKYNLYIYDQALWALKVGAGTVTREIDFEEEEWLHDNHHIFTSTDGSSGNRLMKLFNFNEITGSEESKENEDLKIKDNEEVLI